MQRTGEGRAILNAVRIMSVLAIATWLGTGCGKTEKPKPPPPEATQVPESVEDEKWEPETVKPQDAGCDHGHSHGPGGHSH